MASKVMDLIYWREMERTGIVFTGLVVGLLCMFQLSAITVVSHLSLAVMCFTVPVRLLFKVLELLRWSSGAHPFQSFLDTDSTLTEDQTVFYVHRIVVMLATGVTEVNRLLFVASLFDTLKFILLMYLLTYVGVLCNGLTLLIIGVICVFSLPLFYKRQQERIDKVVRAVTSCTKKIKNLFRQLAQMAKRTPAPAPPPPPTHGPKSRTKSK
ncbi:reticulon-2-like isoform X1 [Megalops cyprinoides]|uniref:reticulon-2-like isoform X1 n=2 Tax=Megalops cyprinoides TaxID=118141 RepID=UPI0018647002|nr:reticulon-2-like isoform X1 [Megalops cyprinoides]